MNPSEINRLIAEKCGWKIVYSQHRNLAHVQVFKPDGTPCEEWPVQYKDKAWMGHIPDYYNSLDACREFETTAGIQYWANLHSRFYRGGESLRAAQQARFGLATSQERCEEFLKLHNLWREEG